MLRKLTRETWKKYVDYAYELALCPAKTSYPVYYDGIKTKEDFISRAEKAFDLEEEEILLYLEEGEPCGWIHYYGLEEERYLGIVSMSFSAHMERGLEAFLTYVGERFPNCEIDLGFPEENRQALTWLAEKGFEIGEESYNDVFVMEKYQAREEAGGIARVTAENFPLFAKLHSLYEGEMYWNCERLRRNLDKWRIFLYCEGEVPLGAVCCTGDGLAEIFGVDFADGVYRSEVFRILTEAALNACKAQGVRNLVFFNDRESQPDALSLGFTCVGKYVLMVKKEGFGQ